MDILVGLQCHLMIVFAVLYFCGDCHPLELIYIISDIKFNLDIIRISKTNILTLTIRVEFDPGRANV